MTEVPGDPHGSPVSPARQAKPRTIITADPELDDLNSVIRLLLYSNELRIEGLVYASSRFHWKGDGRGTTFFLPDREYDEPREFWRWAPGERFLEDAIDAYERVHANLVVHDPEYPHPDRLRCVVREGNVRFEGDMSEPTPGSRLIEEALLDDEPGPLHLQNWAGTSTVARALRSIEERYRDRPEWGQVRDAVSAKAILLKFASQDATYEEYIRPNWPGMRVIDVASYAWGYLARRVVLPRDEELLGAQWLRRNVLEAGPLGALYRVWGDGRQMVPGDYTDYFHLSGIGAEELRSMGFRVWVEPRPAGEWVSEGDTTNMLNLVGNGLRSHEHPGYGGWGGRAVPPAPGTGEWTVRSVADTAPDGSAPEEYSVTRWFRDAQHDFAARLRWSVTPGYEGANHHPVVTVSPAEDVAAPAGSRITIAAEAQDPDGDPLSYRWWWYPEAGTCRGPVLLSGAETPVVTVDVPAGGSAGETIHVILEVRDDGAPPLVAYRRTILTIDGTAPAAAAQHPGS